MWVTWPLAILYWGVIMTGLAGGNARPDHSSPSPAASQLERTVVFVENLGQWDLSLKYVAWAGLDAVGVGEDGILLWKRNSGTSSSVVRLGFHGAPRGCAIEATDEQLGLYNFFLGNDPEKWVRHARSFARVRYRELWPGVDLELHGTEHGLKYDLLLAKGADLGQVVLTSEGAELSIEGDGRLRLESETTTLWQETGKSWQVREDGSEQPIDVSLRLLDEHRFGFHASGLDSRLKLVIDPSLAWSTYLGSVPPVFSSTFDAAWDVATGSSGDVSIVGQADWFNFPTTPGTYQHPGCRGGSCFVTHLRGSDGALLYSSLIGGLGFINGICATERATCVTIDDQERTVVGGWTASSNFPTTAGAFDTQFNSFNYAGFVLALDESGDLEFSTFLESNNLFYPNGITVDPRNGAILVAGTSCCGGLPTTAGAFQLNGDTLDDDGYIARLDATGSSVEWGSYLGGTGSDQLIGMSIDPRGRIAVTGFTTSPNFPVTPGVYQSQFITSTAFVTVFVPRGNELQWSTLFGSTGFQEATSGSQVAFDPQGGVIIAGSYGALNPSITSTFPSTSGAFQTSWGGTIDGFLARLSPGGSSLVFSTLIGGTDAEYCRSLEVDKSGVATVSGTTSNPFPTTVGAYDTTWNGGAGDAFVARFNPSGSRLLYSTYIGGPDEEYANGLGLSREGRVTITGYTYGQWPTTPNAFDPNYNGGQHDCYVTSLDLLLEGVSLLGASTHACRGPLNLNAYKMPTSGDVRFGFYLSGAPSSTTGTLLVGVPASSATQQQGIDLWLDPTQPITQGPFTSDADGYAEIRLSLGSYPAGSSFAVQALVDNTSDCAGAGTKSASQAVVVIVQ